MLRVYQYIKRWANIYLTALPGSYEKRKIEILDQFFKKINQLLAETGLEYWIDFGTLLGHHREKGIIPHDIDIDFGMMESSYNGILSLRNKLPAGVKLYDTSSNHRGPKVYFSFKGVDADIYFYEDLNSVIRSYENSKYPNETSEISKNMVFPVKAANHLRQETSIPSRTIEYLEHIYGYIGADAIRDAKTGYWIKKSL